MIHIDDGFMFGIGAFETIAVENGKPQLLNWHIERLMEALAFLGIAHGEQDVRTELDKTLGQSELAQGRHALKVIVTPDNLLSQTRPNPYTPKDYERGFDLRTSAVRRNETSPFTFRKTLNYGDCIIEKRRAHAEGFDEPLFLNTRGEIAEGATTNIFFVRGADILTPSVQAGLLPGVMRRYICERLGVEECSICPDELGSFNGAFVTNSLIGAMPVRSLDGLRFPVRLPECVQELFPISEP